MSRYLVTGGAGFIGSTVVDALLGDGHRVTVLDDLTSGFPENVALQADLELGDVRDYDAVSRSMRECHAVFHLAASVGNLRSIESPAHDAQVNLVGTVNVLEAARSLGVKKVIYSSSAAVFGELVSLPITEDHPQRPDSPYGVSKAAAERECLVYNALHGMANVCLRYFNVYGPRQRFDAYGNVIPIFVEWMLSGRALTIYGDGEQTRDFVRVGDVVQANLSAASCAGGGVFNIGCGASFTINQLARFVNEVGPDGVSVRHEPARPGEVRFSAAAIDAAREALDYRPDTDLKQGLREYIAWLSTDPLRAGTNTEGTSR